MFFLNLAFLNIFRNKRRSIFTILTIMGCFVLCSVAIGLVYGTYGKVINTFTKGHSGHIQIHAQKYLERPSLFKNIKNYNDLENKILQTSDVIGVSPRVISSVLISKGDKTTGAKLIGLKASSENTTTTINQKVEIGSFISDDLNNEIVVGNALAKILELSIGDEIVMMTQAADGSTSNDLFKVRGIFSEASDAMESRNVYLNLQYATDFLVLGNRIHEIVISVNHYEDAEEISKTLQTKIPELEVSSWQKVEAEFYKAMMADQTGIWINLGIMLFIVSIGVLNTVLMTILERTREFGILKAIGTRPNAIFYMVVLETSILAIVSVLIGIIIAVIINYKLSQIGIPYPMPIEIGGMALHHLYGQLSFFNLWVPALVVTFSSIGVSIIPAIRAAKIVPVKAIRSN